MEGISINNYLAHLLCQFQSSVAASRSEPGNRAVVDVIGAGDLPDWFARFAPLDRLRLLVKGEFRLAPHLYAARLGPFPAFARACQDQVTLELGKPAENFSISRPCDVVVSAHASPKDRKPALRSAITASVFERSRVDRARRSSGVTITHVAAGELVEQAGELLDPAFSRLGVMLFDDPSAAFAKVRRATKLGDRQRWRCSGELVAKRAAQSGTTCCRRRRR